VDVFLDSGKKRWIRAVVRAPRALEPQGARLAARCHVARFLAVAVGHCNGLAFVSQHACRAGPIAVTVHPHRRNLLNGGSASFLGDDVVDHRRLDRTVVHQFSEDVNRSSCICVTLRVCVTESMGVDE
jgi:hypothetical protein